MFTPKKKKKSEQGIDTYLHRQWVHANFFTTLLSYGSKKKTTLEVTETNKEVLQWPEKTNILVTAEQKCTKIAHICAQS